MSEKKKIERFYLDEFLTRLGRVPYRITYGESPDFILVFQQKKIGIEVAEFHSDSKGRKGSRRRTMEENWASLRRTIMEEVRKCDQLKDTNGLLFFKKRELPPKRDHEKFTNELIEISHEMINSDCREIMPADNYLLLNKYLKKFRLEKCRCHVTWEWNYNVSSIGLTETALIVDRQVKLTRLHH